MKKRKCLPYLFSGILLFTLILTTCSGHFSIGASVLDTEPSTNVPTEISSEAPTEVPSGLPDNPQETVFPQKPKPIPQGLIRGKNGHLYFYQNGKKLKNRWKTIKKKTYYFGKDAKACTGKKHISHYLCYFNKKGVLTRKIDKNKKMVALTYDDGPSVYTPTILKTLKKMIPLPHFLWWAAAYRLTPKPYRRLMTTGVRLAITLMITKF